MGENIGRVLSANELAEQGLEIPEGVSVLTHEVVVQSAAEHVAAPPEAEGPGNDVGLQVAAWRSGLRVTRPYEQIGTPEYRQRVLEARAGAAALLNSRNG